jgi:ABC-type multidrug transport system ATPase subunit
MNRLEFDSIEVYRHGRNLLSSVYMSSETGTITALLGRNGCGKTTLLKIVFGATASAQKSVRINGRSLGMHYLQARAIAYLPQGDLIPYYLTIRSALRLFEIEVTKITNVFPEAEAFLDYRPSQLSGGYVRIFEILLVLHSGSPFCFLDEPFTGLTPAYIEKIKEILLTMKGERGILITDHMHKHVMEIADRLYLLANGQTYHITDHSQLVSRGYVNHL